jgi:hypothetical protein
MVGTRIETRGAAGWALVALAALAVAAFGAPATLGQEDKPHVEVYGFVQADYIQDFNRVNPAWNDTLRPSRIPTTEGLYGADGQAIISARQSRLGVLMNFPTSNGAVYTKFEFDMFGVGVDEGQTTIRLRHAYGQWGSWLAGQTNTLFMDAGIFPNVIDYWGPAGMVFYRTPQIRWAPFSGTTSFAVALEKPGNDVDSGLIRQFGEDTEDLNVQGTQRLPDLTAQFRRELGWGHFQVAGILRQVSYESLGTPNNEPKGSETGWGIDATTGIKLGESNKLLLGVVYGEGIASYMNDGGMDMAPRVTGGTPAHPTALAAQSVPLTGISAYLDHTWSPKFTSSIGYSFTSVDNTNYQDGSAFNKGSYASANLLYYPTKNVFVGAEALWGQRKDNDGASGDDTRVQLSFHYSFSTKDIFKKN